MFREEIRNLATFRNMRAKGGYVYIMSNKLRTVLYIGVTSNLSKRVYEHQEGIGPVFTKKYKCHFPIYYEFHDAIEAAIEREKQLKKWKRIWKEELIRKMNPKLKDLSDEVMELT